MVAQSSTSEFSDYANKRILDLRSLLLSQDKYNDNLIQNQSTNINLNNLLTSFHSPTVQSINSLTTKINQKQIDQINQINQIKQTEQTEQINQTEQNQIKDINQDLLIEISNLIKQQQISEEIIEEQKVKLIHLLSVQQQKPEIEKIKKELSLLENEKIEIKKTHADQIDKLNKLIAEKNEEKKIQKQEHQKLEQEKLEQEKQEKQTLKDQKKQEKLEQEKQKQLQKEQQKQLQKDQKKQQKLERQKLERQKLEQELELEEVEEEEIPSTNLEDYYPLSEKIKINRKNLPPSLAPKSIEIIENEKTHNILVFPKINNDTYYVVTKENMNVDTRPDFEEIDYYLINLKDKEKSFKCNYEVLNLIIGEGGKDKKAISVYYKKFGHLSDKSNYVMGILNKKPTATATATDEKPEEQIPEGKGVSLKNNPILELEKLMKLLSAKKAGHNNLDSDIKKLCDKLFKSKLITKNKYEKYTALVS